MAWAAIHRHNESSRPQQVELVRVAAHQTRQRLQGGSKKEGIRQADGLITTEGDAPHAEYGPSNADKLW